MSKLALEPFQILTGKIKKFIITYFPCHGSQKLQCILEYAKNMFTFCNNFELSPEHAFRLDISFTDEFRGLRIIYIAGFCTNSYKVLRILTWASSNGQCCSQCPRANNNKLIITMLNMNNVIACIPQHYHRCPSSNNSQMLPTSHQMSYCFL